MITSDRLSSTVFRNMDYENSGIKITLCLHNNAKVHLRIRRNTTLAFYVPNLSSVGPEIEAAPGLGRLPYYRLLYFPLHSIRKKIRCQNPAIRHQLSVCLLHAYNRASGMTPRQRSCQVSHYCVMSQTKLNCEQDGLRLFTGLLEYTIVG